MKMRAGMTNKTPYIKYYELADRVLRLYIEKVFTLDFREGYFVESVIKDGDRWIIRLEKKP